MSESLSRVDLFSGLSHRDLDRLGRIPGMAGDYLLANDVWRLGALRWDAET